MVDGPAPERRLGALPVIACWIGDRLGGAAPDAADLAVGPDDLADVVTTVTGAPLAATSLAVLLRAMPDHLTGLPNGRTDVEHALAAESATYSLLQAGPEFAAWRAGHPADPPVDGAPTVVVERVDDHLVISLDRPHRHNAITARLRDDLCAALTLAVVDGSIARVTLRGNGPSFCSGGDLDEFGSRPDPVRAHVVRLTRSPARLVHRLRDRVTVLTHGVALGGGIELAAFAGRVVADPATRFGLPEVGLGLIPGAGGTVSITRRCGRQRTAALALCGRPVDAATALGWGLVDEIARA